MTARPLDQAKVLIVDDERSNVQLLERLLARAGFTSVVTTTDPARAADLYREHQPDIVLLDLLMPGVDGFEVLDQLRRLIPADAYVPILILTGDVTFASREQALTSGARDFLLKPFDHVEVILRIRNLLETRRLHQALESLNRGLEETVRERTQDLRASEQRARLLSRHVVEAQEAERRRLALELHDELGQAVTAIKLNLQNASGSLGSERSAALLGECITMLDGVLDRVRTIGRDLRPPLLDDLGLEAAVGWYVRDYGERAGLVVELEATVGNARLPAALALAALRIAQEAVTNVVRHARATTLRARVAREADSLVVQIADDGIGFDVATAQRLGRENPSLGLVSMEERAALVGGTVEITSTPGTGTSVRAVFPLPAEAG